VLGHIIPSNVTVVSVIDADKVVSLIRGNTYTIDWITPGTWPDLTGATIQLVLFPTLSGFFTGKPLSVLVPTGANATLRGTFSSTETSSMEALSYIYHINATMPDTSVVTLVNSTWNVSTS